MPRTKQNRAKETASADGSTATSTPQRTEAPRLMQISDLPGEVRTVADWAMREFATKALWPTQAEAIVECYDRKVHQNVLTNYAGKVFQPQHRGSKPALVTIAPWLLHDSGLFARAFNTADRVFRAALAEVHRAKDAVNWSAADVVKKLRLAKGDKIALEHLAYLMAKANFLAEEPPTWRIIVQLHHLTFPEPTMDEVFVSRPWSASGAPNGNAVISPQFVQGRSGRSGQRPTTWVFVGSTWTDLGEDYRPKVLQALLSQKMLPLGMENWPSGTELPIERSLADLALANLALFVLGERYGSPAREGDPRSFTEVEYDTAVSNGLEVIAFVSEDNARWDNSALDPQNAKSRRHSGRRSFDTGTCGGSADQTIWRRPW